jgi:uncharacterized delta-60 repeat protein
MAGIQNTSSPSKTFVRLRAALLAAGLTGLVAPLLAAAAPGDPDPGFGAGGVAYVDTAGESESVRSAVTDANGRIVIASRSTGATVIDRLLPDGSVDAAFGDGGRARLDLGEGQQVSDDIATDGSAIVTAGHAGAGGSSQFIVSRFTPDGTLDSGFGDGGVQTTPIARNAEATSVAVAEDGSVVAGGETDGRGKDPLPDVAIVRYTASGALDESFADGGIWTRDLVKGPDRIEDVEFDERGGVLFAGAAGPSWDEPTWMIAGRLKPNGELDRRFGDGGIRRVFVSKARTAVGSDIAIDRKGRIALAGRVQSSPGSRDLIGVARLTSGGDLDRSFAKGGRLRIRIDGEPDDVAFDGNRIVLAGKAEPYGFSRSGVAIRVTRDGKLDRSFGDDGVDRIHEGVGQSKSIGILTSQSGRYLVVGEAYRKGLEGQRTQLDPAVVALKAR